MFLITDFNNFSINNYSINHFNEISILNYLQYFYILLFFSFTDITIRTNKCLKKILPDNPQSCYYLLHTFFNLYISYLTFPSVYYSFTNHEIFYKEDHTQTGCLICIFHIYHTINYFKYLNYEDLLHHLMSWIVTYNSIVYELGAGANIIAFFMCGLPGVFYYGPLFLSLKNYISRSSQKKINLNANFIRCIGIIYGVSISNFIYVENKMPLSTPFFNLFLSLLCIWNATYFLYIVIIDYHKNQIKLI